MRIREVAPPTCAIRTGCRRARDPGKVVMLGQPEPREPEPLGQLRQLAGPFEGLRDRSPFDNRGEVEHGTFHAHRRHRGLSPQKSAEDTEDADQRRGASHESVAHAAYSVSRQAGGRPWALRDVGRRARRATRVDRAARAQRRQLVECSGHKWPRTACGRYGASTRAASSSVSATSRPATS